MSELDVRFQCARISELSASDMHSILSARSEVFVVEQNCVYQDPDQYDRISWHLLAWVGDELGAYLRIVDPGCKYAEPSIGRVITRAALRGTGLGRTLMAEGLRQADRLFAGKGLRISAQEYLVRFYESFGFVPESEVYLEDDIPHVEMFRA